MPAGPNESRANHSINLTTSLGPRLALPGPIVAAAGAIGYGVEIADLADIGALGALTTPTLTLTARVGDRMPRTAEATAGLIHALGLPNPGLEVFLSTHLPNLCALPCPLIVSITADTPEDWKRLAEALAEVEGPTALELNLTPQEFLLADHARQAPPDEATQRSAITAAVSAVRRATALPLIAKLPAVSLEIGIAARCAADAGADVIAVAQSFPAVAVRLSNRAFRFPGVVGSLSGPAIKPLALYQVWRVRQAVDLPILGMGGIMTAEDALEFFLTGANAVAVGVANLVHPSAIARITADLSAYLRTHNLTGIDALRAAFQGGI